MLRSLLRGTKALVLLSMAISGPAFGQVKRTVPARTTTNDVSAALHQYQTPAERSLLPYVKAHPMLGARDTQLRAQDQTNYVTTPNFGGYVNAPSYDARTTASLDTGSSFTNGVVAELSADFNKDSKADIAVLQQDGTVNILLNDGKGGLLAPVSYYNPNYLTSGVTVAYTEDVNKDGYPDIIAFDYSNNTMITWLNLGNGTFNASVTYSLDTTNGYPNFVMVKDVTGDGKPDLVYTTFELLSRTSANVYLEVQPGNGDGTFALPAGTQTQHFNIAASGILPTYGGIAVGDIDGDGNQDVAVVVDERMSSSTGQYVVTTALGNGDGSFSTLGQTLPISTPATSSSSVVSYNSTGVQLLDLNGDGTLDVVSDINGVLLTALGQGNGSFSTPVSTDFAQIVDPAQIVFTDLNVDGKADLVVGGGTLAVYLGNGDGTFAAPGTKGQYVTDPAGGISLAVGDFNSDGFTDIAYLGEDYKQVALYYGNGQGQLRGAPMVTAASDPEAILWTLETTGKYTASGYSDAVMIHKGLNATELLTAVNDGKGNFSYVSTLANGIPSDLEYIQPIHADLNSDGKEDLVFAGTTSVTVALSNGDGTFAALGSTGLTGLVCPVYYAAAGDVNGDGKTDLVIPYGGDVACGSSAGGASGYYVLLGNGDGTFAAPVFTSAGTELYSATLADVDGDGVADLVLDDAPFASGSGYNILLAKGKGDGTFNAPTTILSNYLVANVAVGDINGDGKQDLVLSAEEVEGSTIATGGILTLTGNGDGTFNAPTMLAAGNFFWGLQLADMNNDGNPDIVATLYGTNDQPKNYYGMVTLLGLGNGQFSAPVNQSESLASELPQVGNFVNDSAPDVMTETGYGPALFIGQGGTSLSLGVTSSLATFGTSEILTATLAVDMTGRPTATGSVAFYDGTTLLGTEDLTGNAATFTTTELSVGNHTLTAVYTGDGNFNPAKASATAITIAALDPAFVLTGTPTTLSLTSGNNGVVALGLAANASFSGAVTLTCSGAPANATCTVNPGSVTLAAGQTATATLVIGTTTAKSAVRNAPKPWSTPAAITSLAALFGVFFGCRKQMRMLSMVVLGLVLSCGGLLTGCGNEGSSIKAASHTSFTVTVTATPASGSTAVAQTTTVNVKVN